MILAGYDRFPLSLGAS